MIANHTRDLKEGNLQSRYLSFPVLSLFFSLVTSSFSSHFALHLAYRALRVVAAVVSLSRSFQYYINQDTIIYSSREAVAYPLTSSWQPDYVPPLSHLGHDGAQSASSIPSLLVALTAQNIRSMQYRGPLMVFRGLTAPCSTATS